MAKAKHEIFIGFTKARLTVIGSAPRKNGYVQWVVRCECGTEKPMYAQQIYGPNDISCGCYGREQRAKSNTKHGHNRRDRKSGEYTSWWEMIQRCYRPGHISYKNYGGRGISVCDQWRRSFGTFLADMGQKPTPRHWLDRKETNGNYNPGNCRWATPKEQLRNTRRNRVIEYQGERLCLSALAERFGLTHSCLSHRLKTMSVEQAVAMPARYYKIIRK